MNEIKNVGNFWDENLEILGKRIAEQDAVIAWLKARQFFLEGRMQALIDGNLSVAAEKWDDNKTS